MPAEARHAVMVTGHRPEGLSVAEIRFARTELARLCDKLSGLHPEGMVAISGMARGADVWWAEVALDAGIALHAVCPHPDQPKMWQAPDVRRWEAALARAEAVTWIADSSVPWSNRLLFARNTKMVDLCDEAIAVWRPTRTSGGTFHCVNNISRRTPAIPLITVNLDTFDTTISDDAERSSAPTSTQA